VNFDLSEDQQVIADLAAQIFTGATSVDRLKEVEKSDERIDRALWKQLADANLLGLCLPEEYGGSGLGMVELSLILIEQGRTLAPVPVWSTVAAVALPIAEFGTAAQKQAWLPRVVGGEVMLSAAITETGANDPMAPVSRATRASHGGWLIDGFKPMVAAAQHAAAILVSAADSSGAVGLFLVEAGASGLHVEPEESTTHEATATVTFANTPAERLGGDDAHGREVLSWMLQRSLVGLCALQVGVGESATKQTAEYVSGRLQFGKPLSTFQAVGHQAADAFIYNQAMRATTMQAAWNMGEGIDARASVLVAKYWASEGGGKVVHLCQHLHGGMGADIDYPIHRYFLWGLSIENALGAGSAQLARLGELIAKEA
jgi:3-oxocholest-4-en-26-oyl-CoA dehydrogenase beta subunit